MTEQPDQERQDEPDEADQDAGPPGNGVTDLPGPHPDPPVDDDLNVTEENADEGTPG